MPYHNWGGVRVGSKSGLTVYSDLAGVRSRLAAVAYAVSLNTASTDVAVPLSVIPGGYTGTLNYIVRGFTIANATATLSTSPTISLFTGAGGTGNTLVSAQAVTGVTTPITQYLDITLAASATGTIQTAPTLYIRTGASNQTAAFADFYIYIEVLP